MATAAQKQAAHERRERFKAICQRVAAMGDDERAALVARCGAVVTCDGRALSAHNSCLLLHQLPVVSMVGGFRQWLDKGRCVRKGEKGLSMWIPRGGSAGGSDTGDAADDCDSKAARPRFLMGTVFDISQTEELQPAE